MPQQWVLARFIQDSGQRLITDNLRILDYEDAVRPLCEFIVVSGLGWIFLSVAFLHPINFAGEPFQSRIVQKERLWICLN